MVCFDIKYYKRCRINVYKTKLCRVHVYETFVLLLRVNIPFREKTVEPSIILLTGSVKIVQLDSSRRQIASLSKTPNQRSSKHCLPSIPFLVKVKGIYRRPFSFKPKKKPNRHIYVSQLLNNLYTTLFSRI